jgi:hypothetical protein
MIAKKRVMTIGLVLLSIVPYFIRFFEYFKASHNLRILQMRFLDLEDKSRLICSLSKA